MAISKYTLYKYVKVDSTGRYCKAAYHSKIKPDVVFLNVKEGRLEKHPEGRYLHEPQRQMDRRRRGCTRSATETQAAVGA
jgi:hypothetical protein